MADETTQQVAPPVSATIPIPTTEPELPLIPLDESALNPEYDPAKDRRAAFLKTPINPTGPTISPAPTRSVEQVIKEAVTENIPQFSSRTNANPNYGKQSFLPDSEIMTQQQRREAPTLAGALDVASELASPATIGTVAATAGVGEAGVIPKVLSGLFAGQIAASVYDQYPALKDAVNRAQTAKTKEVHDDAFADAQRILTHMGADTVMGLLAAKHGAEGAKEILDTTTGSGVPDQASTFKNPGVEPAPEPEETHPEMNRDTVKQLQKLGYSNQHITNFNIGEIRDILKNQTPAADHPVSKPAVGPEPDKFAEAGGKLVGPSPKAAVSMPAETPTPTETAATDPIEDLIMSDKIGGKKVRGATPKAADTGSIELKRADARGMQIISDLAAGDAAGWIAPDGKNKVVVYEGDHDGVASVMVGKPENKTFDAPTALSKQGWIRQSAGDAYAVDKITPQNIAIIEKAAIASGYTGKPLYIDYGWNPKTGTKSIEIPEGWTDLDRTPQIKKFLKQPALDPEAFAEHGGKMVGKSPEAPAPAIEYHPDLQKVIDDNGGLHTSAAKVVSPDEGSFITPDGKFVSIRGTHDIAIGRANPENRPEGILDNRPGFVDDTATIRTRMRTTKAENTLSVTVPKDDVSSEQVDALQRVVQAMGKNGNLVIERADVNADNKDAASTIKEQVKPYQVEDALREIGAHPDQHDLISKELQTPHKETYGMEVTDREGKVTKVPVDAHSPKQALATVSKKFPDTVFRRIATMPEERVPSTDYSVPTEKIKRMPASMGRPEIHTIRHELGHVFNGLRVGMKQEGMLTSTHPDVSRDTRAAVKWDSTGLWDYSGKLKSEKLPMVVTATMGGIAADEVFNDVPRAANHNFSITAGGDGTKAYKYLRKEGMSHEEAMDFMHQKIDENVEYLKHPIVTAMMHENAGVRETGLSGQFHMSPERLDSIVAETNRRMQNAKQEAVTEKHDNGTINGRSDQDSGTTHAGREGAGSQGPVGESEEGQITHAEKETNQPNLRNRAVVEQTGETTPTGRASDVARGEGEVQAADKGLAPEGEEGIVSEEKIKKTAQEPPEITPNDKQQAKNDAMVKGIAGMIKSGTTRVNATQAETAAKAARAGYEIIKSGGDIPGPRNGLISSDGKYTIDTKNNHEEFRDAVGITEDEQFDQGWVRKAGPEAFQFGALKSPHSPAVNEVERQIIVGAQDGPIFVAGDDFTLDTTKDEIIRKGLGTLIDRAQRQGKK